MKNICFILNIGAHYRYPIYSLIGKRLDCHICLGDHMKIKLKKFDYNSLKGFKEEFRNLFIGPFYWQCGALKYINKGYKYIVTTGDVYCLSTWVILFLAKLYKVKVISWTHGLYGNEGFIKKKIKSFYYNLHYHIMTYGEFGKAQTVKVGISTSKITAIGNSLDSDNYERLRRKMSLTNIYQAHFNNLDSTIIYCGRIQKIKKLDMIISVIKSLNSNGIHVNGLFIGADVDGVNLKQKAHDYGLDNRIWFYGPCYDERKLAEFFYNSAVCVSPGNVGLTAIHSLSFGCPVITHDNVSNQMPEFESIRKGITGDFFMEGDQDDLYMKIKKGPYEFLVFNSRQ